MSGRWRLPLPTRPRVIPVSPRSTQPGRDRCAICGRRKLSSTEYNWRRKNGYAAWRCQHRRPSPSAHRDLLEAVGVIAFLGAYLLLGLGRH